MNSLRKPSLKALFRIFNLAVLVFGLTVAGLFAQKTPGTIVVGVTPGPYRGLFQDAIQPSLEKKGYKIVYREFSDYVQPNLALNNGDLDANLFQHRLYLEKFSADKGLSLTPVISVPTASMGLYSRKVKSIKDLKKGDIVTLANDPTNLARSLRFLAALNIITIKKEIDPTQASERDIDQNPLGLVFRPLEAAQLPRTLDSAAASLVTGNFALASGLKLNEALALESMDDSIINLVAVKTKDVNATFVKDLKEAVESEFFKQIMTDPKLQYASFQRPTWFKIKVAGK